MLRSSKARDDRIDLRASREEKRVLATAAAYERLDLTSFVLRSVLPAAQEIVAREVGGVALAIDAKDERSGLV